MSKPFLITCPNCGYTFPIGLPPRTKSYIVHKGPSRKCIRRWLELDLLFVNPDSPKVMDLKCPNCGEQLHVHYYFY